MKIWQKVKINDIHVCQTTERYIHYIYVYLIQSHQIVCSVFSTCVTCVFSELYQSLQQLPAAAVSSVSVQSDWGRFLYDAFSLCEHILTVGIVETLTVVNCCIFSLNSTDGQSEVRVWSTACKTNWNPWCSSGSIVNEKFRSFSISLLVPG